MNTQKHRTLVNLGLGVITLLYLNIANAQGPGNIARLSYISGPVTFSPAGTNQWVYAKYNRPLITGDKLWTDHNAKAELQLSRATVSLGSKTSVKILNLDNNIGQFQLTQGTLYLRVWSLKEGQTYEMDTPNLAFLVKQPGTYRIDVDANKMITKVSITNGQGEIYAANANYIIENKHSCVFSGTNLSPYKCSSRIVVDDFDRWSSKRNSRLENAVSTRYVSREIIGYEDLDNNGRWRTTAKYGSIWVPSRVSRDWAPYRHGHWTWVSTWGWTWVDDEVWGFAPAHYGRWVYVNDTWGWIPPNRNREALYAPALVVFVGSGRDTRDIAWFPIGPGEVYVPSYSVSRDYFIDINTSNTRVDNDYVTRFYHNRNENINFINRRVPNAITMVPTKVFVQSQEVSRAMTRVSKETIDTAKITAIANVAPVPASVVGEAKPANITPPEKVLVQPVVAKTTPPPSPVPFDAVQSKLAEQPGKPLTSQEVTDLKPTTPATADQIKVVNPTQSPVPVSKAETLSGSEQQPSTTSTTTTVSPGATPSEPDKTAPIEGPDRTTQPSAPVPHPPESNNTVTPSPTVTPESREGAEPDTQPSAQTPRPPEMKNTSDQPIERPEVTPSQNAAPASEDRAEPVSQPAERVPQTQETRSLSEQPVQQSEFPATRRESVEPQTQRGAQSSPRFAEPSAPAQQDQSNQNDVDKKKKNLE